MTKHTVKNLIIKTAIITFSCVALFLSVGYICLATFAPAAVADFFADMGDDDVALFYREKAYNSNRCQNNLEKVTDAAINAENDEKIIKYAGELLQYADKAYYTAEYYAYVSGAYSVALYKSGDKAHALEKAEELSVEYGDYNAIEQLIAFSVQKNDNDFLSSVLHKLVAFDSDTLSAEAKARLDMDVANLTKYLDGQKV